MPDSGRRWERRCRFPMGERREKAGRMALSVAFGDSSPGGGAKKRVAIPLASCLPLWGRCPRRGRRGRLKARLSPRERAGRLGKPSPQYSIEDNHINNWERMDLETGEPMREERFPAAPAETAVVREERTYPWLPGGAGKIPVFPPKAHQIRLMIIYPRPKRNATGNLTKRRKMFRPVRPTPSALRPAGLILTPICSTSTGPLSRVRIRPGWWMCRGVRMGRTGSVGGPGR